MATRPLSDRVAVVAGGSRGAGRGIARALGEAGATVWVAGRTSRGGPPSADGSTETVEETAEDVSARGGRGIPVRADLTVEADVEALFSRVAKESGRLDVLALAVYGASDAMRNVEEMSDAWGKPFWEQRSAWKELVTAGPGAYYLATKHAIPLMLASPKRRGAARGLVAGITDNILPVDGEDADTTAARPTEHGGNLLWTLSHRAIDLLMRGMSAELKKRGVAVVTLMPGFMRTERVLRFLSTERLKKQFRLDLAESTLYVGRAVAALAADPRAIEKTGRIHYVADLAEEYGFTDEDGRRVPRFKPFG
jgi:NAD(P)-dependent dehydrogenase (short-subunit alcohol dehydrogenase family)